MSNRLFDKLIALQKTPHQCVIRADGKDFSGEIVAVNNDIVTMKGSMDLTTQMAPTHVIRLDMVTAVSTY